MDTQISKLLLDKVVAGDVEWIKLHQDEIKVAITGKDEEIVDEDGRGPFHYAVNKCPLSAKKEVFDALGHLPINIMTVDEAGWTCLHLAASIGECDCINYIVKAFSNLNGKSLNTLLEAKTDQGTTALLYAASKGHLACVKALLDAGADINAKDRLNHTPISRAVCGGRIPVFEYLVEQPNIQLDMQEVGTKDTLLHIAVNSEQPSMYYRIAMALPDLETTKNAEGKCALEPASPAFMKRLENYFKQGAKSDNDEE